MKKLLYIILAALLVLSLAGCKGKSNNTPSDNPAPENEAAAQQETEPAKEESAASSKFVRGTWDASGKVFTSDFSGLKITLTDDFRHYDDTELAETYLSDSAFSWDTADYETMTTIPDCVFLDTSGNNVSILFENVALEGAPNISEEDYLDIVTKSLGGEENKRITSVPFPEIHLLAGTRLITR